MTIREDISGIVLSVLDNGKSDNIREHITIGQLLDWVEHDETIKQNTYTLHEIIALEGKEAYSIAKGRGIVPVACPSSRISIGTKRSEENVEAYTGIVYIDIDSLENPSVIQKSLEGDPFIFAVRTTASGNGLRVYFYVGLIDSIEDHVAAWSACEDYIQAITGLQTDKAKVGRSPWHLDFVNHDSNQYTAVSYTFTNWQRQEEEYGNSIRQSSVAFEALHSIPAHLSYADWTRICAAFRRAGGDFDVFHNWSATAANYKDEADCLKEWNSYATENGSRPIKAGTLFWYAKQFGWEMPLSVRQAIANRLDVQDIDEPEPIEGVFEETRLGLEHILDYRNLVIRWNKVNSDIEYYEEEKWNSSSEHYLKWLWSEINSTYHTRSLKGTIRRIKFGINDFMSYMSTIGRYEMHDPFADWLDSLPQWDGIKRLDYWITESLGKHLHEMRTDDELELEMFANALIPLGLIKRTIQPGAVHDIIPVLSGPEGNGKSTLCRYILPKQFHEHYMENIPIGASSKTIIEDMRGVILGEWAEMAGINRRELEQIKTSITTRVDRARVAYSRQAESVPRRWIAWATANTEGSGILPESGGENRRFIVIETAKPAPRSPGEIIEYLDENREQIFAEAIDRIHTDFDANILPPHLGEIQASSNREQVKQDEGMADIAKFALAEFGHMMINGGSVSIIEIWDAYHKVKGLQNVRPKGRAWEPLNKEMQQHGMTRAKKSHWTIV